MSNTIDMTRGGYQGDLIEEAFKPYTRSHLSHWWHFREVLRASHLRSDHWVRHDGTALSEDEQREFVGLSLLNYAVYMGVVEALATHTELDQVVKGPPDARPFGFRRQWKAAYSSLYSSFTALCNVVTLLADPSRPLVRSNGGGENYYFGQTKQYLTNNELSPQPLLSALMEVHKRLEVRTQMEHYWLIWVEHRPDGSYMDDDFMTKGHLAIARPTKYSVNIVERLSKDISDTAEDYDLVYEKLAVAGGYFDRFLQARGFKVKYEDYGAPHNGSRPRP